MLDIGCFEARIGKFKPHTYILNNINNFKGVELIRNKFQKYFHGLPTLRSNIGPTTPCIFFFFVGGGGLIKGHI